MDPGIDLKLFVDDVTMAQSTDDINKRMFLQANADSLSYWSDDWQLAVQPPKTVSLTLGRAPPYTATFTIYGAPLASVCSVRNLGVTFDAALSFKQHISVICRRASASVAVLFRCFVSSYPDALLRVYIAVVRPALEYACTIWNPSLGHRSPLGCLSSVNILE